MARRSLDRSARGREGRRYPERRQPGGDVRLVELEGTFIKYEAREPHDEARRLHPHLAVAHWLVPVEEFEEAHGIPFLCPQSAEELANLPPHPTPLSSFRKPLS